MSSVKKQLPCLEIRGTWPPETQIPLPAFTPHLSAAGIALIIALVSAACLTWARSGSPKECNFRAGHKAISASANHARQVASLPARPRRASSWRRFEKGLREPEILEFNACQWEELYLPHPPLM